MHLYEQSGGCQDIFDTPTHPAIDQTAYTYEIKEIQSDQKVSVHLMITVQKKHAKIF
jgi:hypothetical protein